MSSATPAFSFDASASALEAGLEKVGISTEHNHDNQSTAADVQSARMVVHDCVTPLRKSYCDDMALGDGLRAHHSPSVPRDTEDAIAGHSNTIGGT
jgi:hypothetical protein